MMDLFLLYIWTRLDAINDFVFLIGFVGAFATVILTIAYFVTHEAAERDEGAEEFRNTVHKYRKVSIVPLIAIILTVVLPSKQDAAIIVGGWGILEISKNEDVQEISNDTLQLIKQKLDKQLDQAKDNVTEESK